MHETNSSDVSFNHIRKEKVFITVSKDHNQKGKGEKKSLSSQRGVRCFNCSDKQYFLKAIHSVSCVCTSNVV